MKIADNILEILKRAQILPNGIRIAEQLDRKTYAEVNKALEAAGFKWSRGAKAHQHETEESETALQAIIAAGEVVTFQDVGFFETTGRVLDRVIELADLKPGLDVLEPSAGTGNIVKRIIAAGCNVLAVEFLDRNFKKLAKLITKDGPLIGMCCDFLAVDIHGRFDRVIMNPPFGKQADLDHVLRALSFLKPGGRLVAVMAAGVMFRENRKTQAFRAAIADHSPEFEELPAGSFKASGTDVNTVILTLVKAS